MVGEPSSQSHPPQEREPPPSRPPSIIRIFRALKRYENRRSRRAKQEKSDRDLIMARWTRKVGQFTAALVAIGVITGVIFWWQLGVMQGQLNEMQAEQRAWVTLDTNTFSTPVGPLIIASNGATTRLNVKLNNSGRTVARKIRFSAELIPWSTSLESVPFLKSERDRVCDQQTSITSVAGFVFFPNEPQTIAPDVRMTEKNLLIWKTPMISTGDYFVLIPAGTDPWNLVFSVNPALPWDTD